MGYRIFANTAFITLYMIIAFSSIGFAMKTVAKSSIGIEVQKMYLASHKRYVYVCVIIWTSFLANSTYQLFVSSNDIE